MKRTESTGPGRVTKTLQPLDTGTFKFVERFGEALVCVRYREDATGQKRFTTVELVVETGTAKRRKTEKDVVEVRIEWRESTLRERAKRLGAILDPQTALWRMERRTARLLGLSERIAA
jgi:hypothetical protein